MITAVFQQTIVVEPAQIDANGHVNNVVFVQWMQELAYAHSSANGYDGERLKSLGASWFVRSHTIRYSAPAKLGDRLLAYTWPARIKRASSLRKYKFVRESDGATVVTGESEWVYVDRETGRPRLLERELLDAYPVIESEQEP